MGKEGELWDDSALIKAFDSAISKYKKVHGLTETAASCNSMTEGNLEAAESGRDNREFCSKTGYVKSDGEVSACLETLAEIEDTCEKNPPLELSSLTNECSSNGQTCSLAPPISSNLDAEPGSQGNNAISSDVKSQNYEAGHSNGQEEYNLLLNKYYEIEDQRQRVLYQLNQYSNWNYQNPVSYTSTSEEYPTSISQPYDTATCYCSYGCQNWVVPCHTLPISCADGSYTDKNCNAIPKGSVEGNFSSEDPIVKTAMVAAKRALSSLKLEASCNSEVPTSEEFGAEISHFPKSTESSTNLDVVLNAWYSAGFYTGKYLSEQALEKGKQDSHK